MKLIIVIITLGFLQVSAATKAQQLTLNEKKASLKKIFGEIRKQTGYDVFYQSEQINHAQPVTVNFQHTPLNEALNIILQNQDLSYTIEDKAIVIKPKSKSLPITQTQPIIADSILYAGTVHDEKGNPLIGANIYIKGSRHVTGSIANNGYFEIYGRRGDILVISYIGFIAKEIPLANLDPKKPLVITLTPKVDNLAEVAVVSNGYQDLPKERATGSFEVITAKQLQHSTDPNLLNRLKGITTSMNFYDNLTIVNSAIGTLPSTDASKSPLNKLSIRGRNTLNSINTTNGGVLGAAVSSGQPLVVIDGVPSPYPIDNVNPNDVEDITILKDAAAASIWGSKAANGVIVIKTKHGGYNRPVNVSLNSSLTVTEKPNLFYRPMMTTSEYVDAQIYQFRTENTNVRTPALNRNDPFYSPVAEILGQQQRGEISVNQMNAQLDAFRGNDIRNDFTKYLFRNASTQSYSLGVDGGNQKVAYRVSGGYDKTLNNTIASGSDRLAFNYTTSYKPVKNLELTANIDYSRRTSDGQSPSNPISGVVGDRSAYYPYVRLVDDAGNPVSIPYKYRPSFIGLLASTYGNKIPDLHYSPLDDIYQGYTKAKAGSLNFNLGANYKLNDWLSANVVYNYNTGNYQTDVLDKQNSFYIRNVVSYLTAPPGTIDPVNGDISLQQQFPNGARYYGDVITSTYHSFRGQLNFNKEWGGKHALNAIAGTEVTSSYSLDKPFAYLGYNEDLLTYSNTLNYQSIYTTLYPPNAGSSTALTQIQYPGGSFFADARVRTYSLFANAGYTYLDRYTITVSTRKDESNLFGVGTNNHGTPYYSLGAGWDMTKEDFYKIAWLPSLRLRADFGYNGNVNPIVQSVATTAVQGIQNNNLTSLRASGSNVTNSLLRPEKTGMLNLGLDFGVKGNRLTGSIEYYRKSTTDLMSSNVVDPSTGFGSLTYNTANLLGWGVDLTLNSRNLQAGSFSWASNFLFSYNRVIVSKLYAPAALTAGASISSYNEGADLSRIYAFRWAGLNPATGDPMSYVNGQPYTINNSSAFSTMQNQPLSTARYFGSAVPVYFGSLRNTFTYGQLSLSANLMYKLGYYFRRPTADIVNYSGLFLSGKFQGIEYQNRWQKPGDELRTNVPSQVDNSDQTRDIFYQNAEINVLKADHIRLQEINLSYAFTKKYKFIKNPRIYANVNNLGVIWRANKLGLDPDVNDLPNPRTWSFGFSANF